MDDLVTAALAEGRSVAALTCYDVSTAFAVVEAAERAGHGVILLVTPKTAASSSGMRVIAALRQLADSAAVPVVVELDHCADEDLILRSVAAGADAVLADGSQLPAAENAAFVARIASVTASAGIVIEAELGGLAGDEDSARAVAASGKTDPTQVAEFMRTSGAHLLAVAVGNVHGHYLGEPELDWELIERICAETDAPLVLHGASGLPRGDLARAAEYRLGKVNVNTEVRTQQLASVEQHIANYRAGGENVLALVDEWQACAAGVAAETIELLSGAGR